MGMGKHLDGVDRVSAIGAASPGGLPDNFKPGNRLCEGGCEQRNSGRAQRICVGNRAGALWVGRERDWNRVGLRYCARPFGGDRKSDSADPVASREDFHFLWTGG